MFGQIHLSAWDAHRRAAASLSASQIWADVVAMAMSLRENETELLPALNNYSEFNAEGKMVVDIDLVIAMLTILSALMDATAEHLEMTSEDLGTFLLMEKFKRDLLDG